MYCSNIDLFNKNRLEKDTWVRFRTMPGLISELKFVV